MVVTLAIGDGANDVPMIQGAHIGVGIRGKEGANAVQAADVAIGQFRFLRNLLLCHGRRAYRRVALYLCYYLYKNVALAWGDVIYAFDVGFNGNIAYPEWLSTAFNAVFTCWPIVLVLAFDIDLPDEQALRRPELYTSGPLRQRFNPIIFGKWMALAAFHGALAWIVPVFGLVPNAEDRTFRTPVFWEASAVAFTLVIFIITLKLFLASSKPPTNIGRATYVVAIGIYLLVFFLLGLDAGPFARIQKTLHGVPVAVFSKADTLLCILFVPLLAVIPDVGLLLTGSLGEVEGIWPGFGPGAKAENGNAPAPNGQSSSV